MSSKFQTVGLVGNLDDERVTETMETLAAHLAGQGVTTLLYGGRPDGFANCRAVDGPALAGEADLVLSVGGDGTMLYATQLVAARGTPLVGINRGRLGFLADIGPDELTASVDEILAGDYVSERRAMLAATVGDGSDAQAFALNDVVVQRSGDTRLIDIATTVDGVFVNTHGCDGLIVATPTGSTAYALSCGGPIIEPSLKAFVVVPICPHTLSDRPIVIDGDSVIEVRLGDRADVTAQISSDGRPLAELQTGQVLTVRAAPFSAELLHPRSHDYFRILRSKLGWGSSSRRTR